MSGERRVILTGDGRRHSVYAEYVAHPPEGVRYEVRSTDWYQPLHGSPARDWLYWKKRALRLRLVKVPDLAPIPDWGAPVHAAADLLQSPRPWVVDFEHLGVLVQYHYDLLYDEKVRARLSRAVGRPECKALVAWTEVAARGARAILPEHADKVRVIYPAMSPRPLPPPPEGDSPLVLFVARRFEGKGGLEALEAFATARRERNPKARMLFVCETPPAVQARFKDEGVTFLPPGQPREFLLNEAFGKASVYLMPSQYDTYGMVYLEAFAHAVPVVGLDIFAMPELVTHGQDGFLVKGYGLEWVNPDGTPNRGHSQWAQVERDLPLHERPRIVRDLADALGELLADPALARRMGERGRLKVTEGHLSIKERNRRLNALYREAFG